MQFEWDESKSAKNLEKHGLKLPDGALVFDDPNRKDYIDERADYGEDRMITIGLGADKVLYVCWTERKDDIIRLISVRPATKQEQRIYNGDS